MFAGYCESQRNDQVWAISNPTPSLLNGAPRVVTRPLRAAVSAMAAPCRPSRLIVRSGTKRCTDKRAVQQQLHPLNVLRLRPSALEGEALPVCHR